MICPDVQSTLLSKISMQKVCSLFVFGTFLGNKIRETESAQKTM